MSQPQQQHQQPQLPVDQDMEPIGMVELGQLMDEVNNARSSERELSEELKGARARTREAMEKLFSASNRVRLTNERARLQLVNKAMRNRTVLKEEDHPNENIASEE